MCIFLRKVMKTFCAQELKDSFTFKVIANFCCRFVLLFTDLNSDEITPEVEKKNPFVCSSHVLACVKTSMLGFEYIFKCKAMVQYYFLSRDGFTFRRLYKLYVSPFDFIAYLTIGASRGKFPFEMFVVSRGYVV